MLEYDPTKRITSKQARTTTSLVASHCCCLHVELFVMLHLI